MSELLFKELSYKVIGCAMMVHNELGSGFLEKVYENAMVISLKEKGIKVEQQKEIVIQFHGETIGNYIADLLVDDKIIIELKCAINISETHKAQIANYLKATGKRLGIIINFGKEKLEYVRIVM